MTAVQELVRHLKANPEDRDARGMALKFGVPNESSSWRWPT